MSMKKMAVSEFKARCIAVLREAVQTGEPILVTRRGVPIARVEPIQQAPAKRLLGVHAGRMKIRGDLIEIDSGPDWEVLG